MLNVDKQGAAICRFGDACYFSARGSHQESAQFGIAQCSPHEGLLSAGLLNTTHHHLVFHGDFAAVAHLARNGGQHHAVGFVGESAVIGLNPADAGGFAEPQAVGRRKRIFGGQARQVGITRVFFCAEQEDVPSEGFGGGFLARFIESDDVAVRVAHAFFAIQVHVGSGVGRVHLGGGAVGCAVVGEGEIHLAIAVVDGTPLRAVHLGGPHGVCGVAGIDEHIGLAGKFVGAVVGNAWIGDGQFQPFALAGSVEASDIQFAFAQVLVTRHHAAAHITRVPHGGGDKFVDVLVARIAAHVESQWLTCLRQATHSGFVRKSSHGHTLDRCRVGGQRVDFDVVAKGVGLVAEIFVSVGTGGCQIPAGEAVVSGRDGVPTLAGRARGTGRWCCRGHAITLACSDFLGRQGSARARGLKVISPVFFAAKVSAPWGFAVAAVVQRTARHAARRFPTRDHEAANRFNVRTRAADAHRCLRSDAAVER